MVSAMGKVESDSQYRGLRYWIENKGSRTSNTHFFRKVRRPDGSETSLGYGKDSIIDCLEKVCRVKFQGASASDLAGTYPDAESQRLPTAVVDAARHVLHRNQEHFEENRPPVVTAGLGESGVTIYDPYAEVASETIYSASV